MILNLFIRKLFKLIYFFKLVVKINVFGKILFNFFFFFKSYKSSFIANRWSNLLKLSKLTYNNSKRCLSIDTIRRLAFDKLECKFRVDFKVHYQFYRRTFCIPGVKDFRHTENAAPVSPLWWRKLSSDSWPSENFIFSLELQVSPETAAATP